MVRLGGSATIPHMKAFQGLEALFRRRGIEMDWVLYSDYDAMIDDFVEGRIDLAWNGPLGYVKIKRLLLQRGSSAAAPAPHRAGDPSLHAPCQVIAMRDVDFDCVTCFIAGQDSGILTVEDLRDKSFAVGSRSSEQPVLAFHFLRQLGIDPRKGLAEVSFYEDRQTPDLGLSLSAERDVIARVSKGEYAAGAVTRRTLEALRESGDPSGQAVRVLWSSPGYSHCCFTAQRGLDPVLTNELTEAFLAVDYGDPLGKEVLDAEGCRSFAPGITEGWEMLEEAAIAEGLV